MTVLLSSGDTTPAATPISRASLLPLQQVAASAHEKKQRRRRSIMMMIIMLKTYSAIVLVLDFWL